MRKTLRALAGLLALGLSSGSSAQTSSIILKPARVFDGDTVRQGWAVRVTLDRIDAVSRPLANTTTAAMRWQW